MQSKTKKFNKSLFIGELLREDFINKNIDEIVNFILKEINKNKTLKIEAKKLPKKLKVIFEKYSKKNFLKTIKNIREKLFFYKVVQKYPYLSINFLKYLWKNHLIFINNKEQLKKTIKNYLSKYNKNVYIYNIIYNNVYIYNIKTNSDINIEDILIFELSDLFISGLVNKEHLNKDMIFMNFYNNKAMFFIDDTLKENLEDLKLLNQNFSTYLNTIEKIDQKVIEKLSKVLNLNIKSNSKEEITKLISKLIQKELINYLILRDFYLKFF